MMMEKKKKPNGYWDYDNCKNAALKCNTITELENKYNGAYRVICKNNWRKDLCKHFIEIKKPNNYWTKEKCQEEALKYSHKKEFQDNCCSAYAIMLRNNWTDDICGHMKKLGNICNRMIYVYEFSDNSAYIGLTFNIDIRNKQHFNNRDSMVYKYMKETNIIPILITKSDYINVEEAALLENIILNEYKNNNWNILNKAKTGNIGGFYIKWTYKKCQEEALKYNTKVDLKNNNNGVLTAIYKNNWVELFDHMTSPQKPKGYWTIEKCQEEALKYNTKICFLKNSQAAYEAAYKKGWLNDICIHMS